MTGDGGGPVQLRLTMLVDDARLGPFGAEGDREIALGRGRPSAVDIHDHWVPRHLMSLRPGRRGWIVENGPRTAVDVENTWVSARFAATSRFVVPEGRTRLVWPLLDGDLVALVQVGPGAADGVRPLHDSEPVGSRPFHGTDFAAVRLRMTDLQRQRLAELFRHLLDDSPRPDNITEAAARRLGISEASLQATAHRYRQRLNTDRLRDIRTLDQLGEYLVEVTGALTVDDLTRRA